MPQTNPFWEPGAGRGTSGRRRPGAAGGAGSALREGREEGAGTVALAVRNSASWLMLDTSGELFMITRIRDSGSDTNLFSPPLNRAAIFPPRLGLQPFIPSPASAGAAAAAKPAGSCSLRPPGRTPSAAGGASRRDYNSHEAQRSAGGLHVPGGTAPVPPARPCGGTAGVRGRSRGPGARLPVR